MKPFNLEEYLANPSRKIVTREGKHARTICNDAKFEKYQVLALITEKDGQEILAILETSGKFRSGYNSHLDLFFATEKPKVEKFDPKTLTPFDMVLVRDSEDERWRAMYFSHMADYILTRRAVCGEVSWKQCIPYNEETIYIVGTKEGCPEYYRWWEE